MYTLQDVRPRPTCEECMNLAEELARARNTVARQRSQLLQMSDNLLVERKENAKLQNIIFQLQVDREVR